MSKIIGLHQKQATQFWNDFDAVTQDSVTLCVVSVQRDGTPGFLLPEDRAHALALVGALDAAKDEILGRLLYGD